VGFILDFSSCDSGDHDCRANYIGGALLALGSLGHGGSMTCVTAEREKAVQDEKANYSAMTVNERLFVAGLLDQFKDATRRGDRHKMIELLIAVDLPNDAAAITDSILNRPTRFGLQISK
jgi:hypothetical protein